MFLIQRLTEVFIKAADQIQFKIQDIYTDSYQTTNRRKGTKLKYKPSAEILDVKKV